MVLTAPTVAITDDISLSKAAINIIDANVIYDGRYQSLVCPDVLIRACSQLNIDLQQLVREDMYANFNHYPSCKM